MNSLEEPITPAGNEIFVKREYYNLVGHPTLLKGYVYDKQLLEDGDTVESGERVQTLITIEAKSDYEYLVFEDLKPPGFESVEIRSGEPLYAKELKSGAVERKFGENENTPQSKRGLALGLLPVACPRPNPENSDYTGRTRWIYQEWRDRKIVLFIDKAPRRCLGNTV